MNSKATYILFCVSSLNPVQSIYQHLYPFSKLSPEPQKTCSSFSITFLSILLKTTPKSMYFCCVCSLNSKAIYFHAYSSSPAPKFTSAYFIFCANSANSALKSIAQSFCFHVCSLNSDLNHKVKCFLFIFTIYLLRFVAVIFRFYACGLNSTPKPCQYNFSFMPFLSIFF